MQKRFLGRLTLLAMATSALLTACGDSSSSSTSSTPGNAATITGSVFAAATNGAVVNLYAATPQGAPTGAPLGTATTDASGQYTLSLTTLPTGPVILAASGGSYASESDNSHQTGGGFSILLPSMTGGSTTAELNPLTSAITANAVNVLSNSPSTTISNAINNASATILALLGVGIISNNPQTLVPDPTATTGDAWVLSALAGTLEQLRASSGISANDLYKAFQDDISDGKLDGLKNGQPIPLGSGGGTLQSSLFTTQLSGAANTYGSNHLTYQSATAHISKAAQTSAQAVGIAIGSSGSIAPLQTQTGGTQIYFAARTDGLIQLDMSNPSAPIATRLTTINAAALQGQFGSANGILPSIDGIVINPTPITINGSSKVYGILYSYASSTVVSVNLTDGVVVNSATINISNVASFSGASAYIAGGIADGQRGLIWLATGDGLVGIDPSDLSKTPITIAQPSGTQINENIGGDPASDIVFSPDYNGQGVVVFNLKEAKAYLMNVTALNALTNNAIPSGTELDGAALDSQYKIAIVTPEDSDIIGLAGYATPSGATTAVGTFSTQTFMAYQAPTGSSYSGSAIDPVTHTALFVGEGRNLGVGVIDNPSNANWKGFSAFVSDGGQSSYQFEPHDPHSLAAFNLGGKPYGFLMQGSSTYKLVVLDLNAMLAAPSTNGILNTDPMINTAITQMIPYQ